jgi:hypothetical protein
MGQFTAGPVILFFLHALGLACLAAGALFLAWLLFMLVARRTHARWISLENGLWVRLGLISPEWAERLSSFERGPVMKVVYALQGMLFVLLGVGLLSLHAWLSSIEAGESGGASFSLWDSENR